VSGHVKMELLVGGAISTIDALKKAAPEFKAEGVQPTTTEPSLRCGVSATRIEVSR
jgi:hypothetical protein